jgi:hypothetical protein
MLAYRRDARSNQPARKVRQTPYRLQSNPEKHRTAQYRADGPHLRRNRRAAGRFYCARIRNRERRRSRLGVADLAQMGAQPKARTGAGRGRHGPRSARGVRSQTLIGRHRQTAPFRLRADWRSEKAHANPPAIADERPQRMGLRGAVGGYEIRRRNVSLFRIPTCAASGSHRGYRRNSSILCPGRHMTCRSRGRQRSRARARRIAGASARQPMGWAFEAALVFEVVASAFEVVVGEGAG